jgi:hypothetical protein
MSQNHKKKMVYTHKWRKIDATYKKNSKNPKMVDPKNKNKKSQI